MSKSRFRQAAGIFFLMLADPRTNRPLLAGLTAMGLGGILTTFVLLSH